MADLSKHVPMAESFAGRADDAGRMARSFLAAIARLAAVEALCSDRPGRFTLWEFVGMVHTAARGEGGRPADHVCPFNAQSCPYEECKHCWEGDRG